MAHKCKCVISAASFRSECDWLHHGTMSCRLTVLCVCSILYFSLACKLTQLKQQGMMCIIRSVRWNFILLLTLLCAFQNQQEASLSSIKIEWTTVVMQENWPIKRGATSKPDNSSNWTVDGALQHTSITCKERVMADMWLTAIMTYTSQLWVNLGGSYYTTVFV